MLRTNVIPSCGQAYLIECRTANIIHRNGNWIVKYCTVVCIGVLLKAEDVPPSHPPDRQIDVFLFLNFMVHTVIRKFRINHQQSGMYLNARLIVFC